MILLFFISYTLYRDYCGMVQLAECKFVDDGLWEEKTGRPRGKRQPTKMLTENLLRYTEMVEHFIYFFVSKVQVQVVVLYFKKLCQDWKSPFFIERNLKISALLLDKIGIQIFKSGPG